MSYEAWGESDDPCYTPDQLAELGWISPDDISKAALDVLKERQRQEDAEGWTPEHDDRHTAGELATAALSYGTHAVVQTRMLARGETPERVDRASRLAPVPQTWPFSHRWWKPSDARRDLVKAGALILAEIERLDRLAEKGGA